MEAVLAKEAVADMEARPEGVDIAAEPAAGATSGGGESMTDGTKGRSARGSGRAIARLKRTALFGAPLLVLIGVGAVAALWLDPIESRQRMTVQLIGARDIHNRDGAHEAFRFRLGDGSVASLRDGHDFDRRIADQVSIGGRCVEVYRTQWFGQTGVDWSTLAPC